MWLDRPNRSAFARAFSLAGPLIAAGFICGIAATAIQSLMPIFGLAHGLSDEGATRLVVVFSLGEAVMVGAFGLAADRFDRWQLLRLSAVPALLVAGRAALYRLTDSGSSIRPCSWRVGPSPGSTRSASC